MATKRTTRGMTLTVPPTSPFAKLAPTWLVTFAEIVGALCQATAITCRVLWPYRVEIGVALTVLTGYSYAYSLTGSEWWALALLALVLALVLAPLLGWTRTRTWTWGVFLRARSRRLILAGLKELRTADSSGRLPRIRRVRSTAVGERMTLVCRPGQSAELLDARVEELRAAAKCRDVRVTRDLNASHKVTVDVVRRDAFAGGQTIPWADQDADVLSMWDPVHFGTDEQGQDVRVSLVERGILFGSEPGGGKSSAQQTIFSHAAKSPDAHLLLIDPNRVQAAPWRDRALAIAYNDPADALGVLELVRAEIDRRLELLELLPGVNRKITREIATDHGLPLWVLGIDELAFHTSVVGTPAQRAAFSVACRDIVARGRAAGVIPVFATQRPTSDVVPTSLRDLISMRCALRTTTAASSDVILGESWSRRGYSATDIEITQRGVAWLLAEGQSPRRIKFAWISDDTIADLSVTTIRHRPNTPSDEVRIPRQRDASEES